MEPLRIRIPRVFHCIKEDCLDYVYREDRMCGRCRLLTRVREEVPTAALTSESKLVHRPTLRSHTGRSC